MKMCNKRYFLLGLVFFTQSFIGLLATDLPVFYRAPFFRSIHDAPSDWKTQATIRLGTGDTRQGWGLDDHHGALFSIYGATDVTQLGFGLEDLATKPITNNYWKKNGTFNPDAPVDPSNPLNLKNKDGQVAFSGKLKVDDIALTVKQTIFSGFYIQAYLPVRRIKIDQVTATNLGAPTIAGGIVMADFLTTADGLPEILRENGYASFTTFKESVFKKTETPEFLLSVGWQGQGDQEFGIVDKVRGFMQAGIIVPTGEKKNEDLLFAIPIGYNKFWGVNCQLGAEVAFWKFVVLGASAGTTMFFSEVRDIRMKTNSAQTGWFMLGKGMSKVDQGSMWDLTGYVKADHVVADLSFIAGYSFNRQEDTQLHVKDDKFLSTYVAQQRALVPPVLVSKDSIVNSDKRLRGWNQHVLHLMAEYSAGPDAKSWFSPIVRFEYSYPIAGRRAFATDMLAGTLGLQVQWAI
ncbi:MAG: hypothetical protein ABH827_04800 [bacterium]